MMKTILFSLMTVAVLTSSAVTQAAVQCDYGGIQVALRNSADRLHDGNPVRFIDFTNDAPFGYALERMRAVGVPYAQVQIAWANAIRQLCGERAQNIYPATVGPNQTLSGLSRLLGISL